MEAATLSSFDADPRDEPLGRLFATLLAAAAIGVGVSYSVVYLFHLVLLAYLLVRLTQLARGILRVRVGGSRYHLPLLLFITWYLLSCLWAPRLEYAAKYIGYLGCGVAIVLSIAYEIKGRRELQQALRVLGAVFCVELSVCLLEIFTPFRYPISPFSNYAVLFGRRYTLEAIDNPLSLAILSSTPTGFEWNPNNLAAVLVMLLPFVMITMRGRWRLPVAGATMLTIVATGSRAGFLATLFMGFVAISARSRKKGAIVALCCMVVWQAAPLFLDQITSTPGRVTDMAGAFAETVRFVTQEESGNNSGGVRQQLMRNGVTELERTKGLGVGAGGSQAIQEKHGTVNGETSMHNFWFEIIVEAGVYVGGLFTLWYVGLVVRMALLARHTRDRTVRSVAHACALSLTGFVLAAVSASSTVYLLPMWLLFGICIGVINASRQVQATQVESA